MRKKIEWQWETLDGHTQRAKVIGGWIVNTHRWDTSAKNSSLSESMIFVPDRDHEWHILAPIASQAPNSSVKANDFEPK